MRVRALLTTGLAVLGLAIPARAATAASVTFTVQFACLGCGWTPANLSGTCTGLCLDQPCTGCPVNGAGEAYTSPGSCALRGELYGDLVVGGNPMSYVLEWSAGTWSMTLADGTPGSGTMTISPCEGPGVATFNGTLGLTQPTLDTTEVSYNDGETGVVLLASSEAHASSLAPGDPHDLTAGCTYKYSRHTGIVTVVGRTHAGRHQSASTTTIRCRLTDAATGVVLFDQTRTEPGTQARLEGTAAASPNRVTVCTRGEGYWGDSHAVFVGLTCKAP